MNNCVQLSLDGDQWCALIGNNLQDGLSGFGDSPMLALKALQAEIKSTPKMVDRFTNTFAVTEIDPALIRKPHG
jgi:hypothetical protein